MNRAEILRMALLNLKRRKMRTLLAVMGVIIGTSAIVVMLSLGLAMSEGFEQQVKEMGDIHMINIYEGGGGRFGGRGMISKGPQDKDKGKITDKTISSIKKMKGVTAVTPLENYHGRLVLGRYSTYVSILGVDPVDFEAFGKKLAEGRMIQKTDKNTVVLGSDLPMGFWDERSGMPPPMDKEGNPMMNLMTDKLIFTRDDQYMGGRRGGEMMGEQGPRVKFELHKVKGVGVLEKSYDRFSYRVIMGLEALQKIKQSDEKAEKDAGSRVYSRDIKKDGYEQAMIYVEDIHEVENVAKSLEEQGFMVDSLIDIVNEFKEMAASNQATLGGIGAVSLLVAALGIANTMLMSIYERTREIGVMKVLGAGLRDIRNLFLTEAALIGLFGGIAGNLLSLLISFAMNNLEVFRGIFGNSSMMGMMGMMGGEGKLSVIPPWLLAAALVFSIFIGIASGYYPARRAMNLSALESLRNE
ncbi:MAG: ABC transporter permease [Peptostreptococcaceae bacterium]|nr:ABC transporter permease [Peptostreptococcaceae bacterium]